MWSKLWNTSKPAVSAALALWSTSRGLSEVAWQPNRKARTVAGRYLEAARRPVAGGSLGVPTR